MHDLLLKRGELVLYIVDVRCQDDLDRACRERDGWNGRARIERLDEYRGVLIVRSGVR